MDKHTLPNIVWICTDQQRFDTINRLGASWMDTPNLDRLCEEGVVFDRTYCQSPVCSPSRASFLSGKYPSTIHVTRNGGKYFPSDAPLITRELKKVGYKCGLSGKLHIASGWDGVEPRVDDGYDVFYESLSPAQGIGRGNQYTDWLTSIGIDPASIMGFSQDGHSFYGYNENVTREVHQTTWCFNKAMDFIKDEKDGPWLFSINPFDPHHPFDAPVEMRDKYLDKQLPEPWFLPSDLAVQKELNVMFYQTTALYPSSSEPKVPDEDLRKKRASYFAMVELIDWNVGRLMQMLDESGLRKNTIVIFTSDHGEMLGDHGLVLKGCRFYEGAVRVPMIFSWPEKFRCNEIVDDMVQLADISTTLAKLTGIKNWNGIGGNLLPYLTGVGEKPGHRYLRSEYYDAVHIFAPEYKEKHIPNFGTMILDGKFKLSVYHGHEMGELYDIENDPHEHVNLWLDPVYTEKKIELLKEGFDQMVLNSDLGPEIIGRY